MKIILGEKQVLLWSHIIQTLKFTHYELKKMCFGENSQGCYCCRRSGHNENTKYISSDNEIIVIGKKLKRKKLPYWLKPHLYHYKCIETY